MRPVQQGNIDLNLLVPLKALLHERNVTRAAERIHLSQSAMSHTLERLRSELGEPAALMDYLLGESRPAASSGCPRALSPCCDPHARNDRPGADYARSNSRARSSPT